MSTDKTMDIHSGGNYQSTINACFMGYVVQAIVNNFAPLLFITFQNNYHIPMSKITLLITINFIIQLLVDLLSAVFVDRVGYRVSIILAHICSAGGLVLLTILPDIFQDSFVGLFISVSVYAIGGGLIEVLISPIVEATPTKNKEKAMSLLHSFYCWGVVGVVLVSTIFFRIFGMGHWKSLSVIWAVLAILNGLAFIKVPICSLHKEGERGLTIKELFSKKIFWMFMLMMMCAGASEQSVSQWASTFAEKGLGIQKAVGDLACPMMFAITMGISRTFYGKYGEKINLDRFVLFSTVLCIVSYLCIVFVPVPAIALAGCSICGLSVGILWPGTLSKAAAEIRRGGTGMFAMLALAGDVGCSAGPTVTGMVSSYFNDNLRVGILAAIIFPVLLLLGLLKKMYRGSKEHVM